MRKLIVLVLLVVTTVAVAQESHYHRALRSAQENAKYGLVGEYQPYTFTSSGMLWSRVRDIDDTAISVETREDSLLRVKEFTRLCRLAYDAYDEGDALGTVVYGDSALSKRFHTPELYFFMAVSYEKIGFYKDAQWAYKKAIRAGHMVAPKTYAGFKKRIKARQKAKKQNPDN